MGGGCVKGDSSERLPQPPQVGARHGCASPSALLKLLLAVWKGAAPGGWDGSQGLFPNLIGEVLLVTQEALPVVLHPSPHRSAVQVELWRRLTLGTPA